MDQVRIIVENTSLLRITVVQVALALCLGGPLPAANLSAPFSLESTQTLPVGIRNPRFISVYTSIDTKFDKEGGLEPLGTRLNKRVTWQDVIDAQSDDSQKNLVRSVINDTNLSMDGTPGTATGVVKTYANIKVPALALGLSESVTVGLVIPIVSLNVAVDTGFISGADGQTFVNHICDSSPDKCNEAAAKLNDATQKKLARLGYEPLRPHTVSGMGDMQLVSKHRWHNTERESFATKLSLVLPTGTRSNPDRALDLTTGDGRFKIALGAVLDYQVWEGGPRWNSFVGYTALLPSRQTKRLPTSGIDSLSKDKEELTRRYGDQVSVGTGLEQSIPKLGLALGLGASTQYLSKTRYSGSATEGYAQTRYTMLEDLEPVQVLHALTTTVGFSTVNWYRQKEFALPFQLNLSYSHPLGGRNAPRNDIVAGEMVLFF